MQILKSAGLKTLIYLTLVSNALQIFWKLMKYCCHTVGKVLLAQVEKYWRATVVPTQKKYFKLFYWILLLNVCNQKNVYNLNVYNFLHIIAITTLLFNRLTAESIKCSKEQIWQPCYPLLCHVIVKVCHWSKNIYTAITPRLTEGETNLRYLDNILIINIWFSSIQKLRKIRKYQEEIKKQRFSRIVF